MEIIGVGTTGTAVVGVGITGMEMDGMAMVGMEIIITTIIIMAEEVLLTLQMEIDMVSEMVREAQIIHKEEAILFQPREIEIPIIITPEHLQIILLELPITTQHGLTLILSQQEVPAMNQFLVPILQVPVIPDHLLMVVEVMEEEVVAEEDLPLVEEEDKRI